VADRKRRDQEDSTQKGHCADWNQWKDPYADPTAERLLELEWEHDESYWTEPHVTSLPGRHLTVSGDHVIEALDDNDDRISVLRFDWTAQKIDGEWFYEVDDPRAQMLLSRWVVISDPRLILLGFDNCLQGEIKETLYTVDRDQE